jgi:Uma2 family endonuclease
MTQPAKRFYSYEEYLALEEVATERNEYFNGEIFVMAGGSPEHSQVAMNIGTRLNIALEPYPCNVYGSDLKIRIEEANYSTYGDVTVVCGELPFYKKRKDVIINPLLIVEVLSPSTRKFDRTEKFEFYRMLASFQHYLMVDPTRLYVEYYQFTGKGWLLQLYNKLEQTVRLELPVGAVLITLSEIYRKVIET